MSDKLKTVFYEQQNYFEKMMGIMLEWYHLLIGMQTTVLLTMVFLGIAVLLIDDLIRSKENVRTVDCDSKYDETSRLMLCDYLIKHSIRNYAG